MKQTGVFTTDEKLDELKKLIATAQHTPVIARSLQDGMEGKDLATRAWNKAREACHAAALEAGLPEIEGFYGIDHAGEFVEMTKEDGI